MKRCNKSHECPYGNAFEKGFCAYRENMNEYDLCPSLLENWEDVIDELFFKLKEEGIINVKDVL